MSVSTAEEAATFLAAIADDRLAALWVLALHTGLRRVRSDRRFEADQPVSASRSRSA
jgi:hypothetical protein